MSNPLYIPWDTARSYFSASPLWLVFLNTNNLSSALGGHCGQGSRLQCILHVCAASRRAVWFSSSLGVLCTPGSYVVVPLPPPPAPPCPLLSSSWRTSPLGDSCGWKFYGGFSSVLPARRTTIIHCLRCISFLHSTGSLDWLPAFAEIAAFVAISTFTGRHWFCRDAADHGIAAIAAMSAFVGRAASTRITAILLIITTITIGVSSGIGISPG